MKKQIMLLCKDRQQFAVLVEEMSVHKVVKGIIADLSNPEKRFICLLDYLPESDQDQEMWVRTKTVTAVVVVSKSNIQTPQKSIMVPGITNRS